MDLLTSPLFVNLLFYAFTILVITLGVKTANGFFFVMEIYAWIIMGGLFVPLLMVVLNISGYFLFGGIGFLYGALVAGMLVGLFFLWTYLESHDYFRYVPKLKKINAMFKESTQLDPAEYIHMIFLGYGKRNTQIYLKQTVEEAQLNDFFEQLNTLEDEKDFEIYLDNAFMYKVKKNDIVSYKKNMP